MKELTGGIDVCLALGYFDSVHLGHRRLIETAREYSEKHGLSSAVATFSNNAYKVFNPSEKAVYTYSERSELLEDKCDYILPMRFDSRLKMTSAKDFLDGLFKAYAIKAVVCGYDYLFGAGAKGDAAYLKSYCDERKVDCIVMDKFELDGRRVSTTVIKDMLAEGNVEEANLYLGTPFMLTGKVVHGRGAGRMFDIPTANIKVPNEKLLPATGVYGTVCVLDGKEYYGATNVGPRPTFGLSKVEVETMLKDFDDNIYDKQIKLYFYKRLRGVRKFDTPALLSKQVHEDINWSEEK